LSTNRLHQLGHGQRLQFGIGLDQHAAVGAHGEGRADRLLALQRSGGKDDDSVASPFSLMAERLFHGDLIEGFMDILTFAVSTPVLSALTRILTL